MTAPMAGGGVTRAPFQEDVIRYLMRTEKGTKALSKGKVLFAVGINATKPQIKRAVEEVFKVKVKSVNTAIVSGKPRRVGTRWGLKPSWKKAMVTLKEGSTIKVAQ